MLTAINNAMEINKKQVKYRNFCVLQLIFFSINFFAIVFPSASITSSHVITEFSIILIYTVL